MKLGITGLLPNTIEAHTPDAFRGVREMGFTGSALTLSSPPAEISTDAARELGERAAAEGVAFVEYGQYQTSFVDPDASVRAQHNATIKEAARVARAAGC